MNNNQNPHWDLRNVFPSLESKEFESAFAGLERKISELELVFSEKVEAPRPKVSNDELAGIIGDILTRVNVILEQSQSTRAYINAHVSTNSRDIVARKKLSLFEQLIIRLQNLLTRFQAWIGELAPGLETIILANPVSTEHAFALKDMAEQSKYMMSKSEEALAAELNLSGASAWNKLQGTVTSQLSVNFDLNGQLQTLPMPALINLHSHQDEEVRHRAYDQEMAAWKTVEEPLAAALNGIKGAAVTLNKHRGRIDALHPAIDMARIDRQTLESMLSAMQDSFPVFRRYFKAKANRLGKDKLAWWDLFAPVGQTKMNFSWPEARDFILTNFNNFSPDLASLAKRAFDNNWIDAEQRDGKRAGAFCMSLPSVKESRILCNFDGSLDQVSTIAHELGHAFHNECAFSAGKTALQQDTPMTLAETASIMCETIVAEALLAQSTDPTEQLAILETSLINDSQIIVDIYSRYLFEKEVFERRAESELSAEDFCKIMEQAQKLTYGESLDERFLMKYMWTWKPHYYYSEMSFYNFPYAFGLLFATGLYAIYRKQGDSFVADYKSLLSSTGEASAADLAARFGIDIRSKKFWADSLSIIAEKINQYEKL